MTRPFRIALISAGATLSLAAIATAVLIGVARSDWLREQIRERIVAEGERATGGKTEIGKFQFDWNTLTAEIDNLVIHGNEPSGEAPLLTVKRVIVTFRILSLMKREFDVERVDAESPQAHLIVQPDGATNIPRPRVRPGKTGPETILELKIGTFDLTNGVFTAERAGTRTVIAWNARGENLISHATYKAAGPRYDGSISVSPVVLNWDGFAPVTANLSLTAEMEKNRLTIPHAFAKTGDSEIDLTNLIVNNFAPPLTGQYQARFSLPDADRIFRLVDFRHTGTVRIQGDIRFVSLSDYRIGGTIQGAGIGYGKIRNMSVAGAISATPHNVEVSDMRVGALGGEIVARGDVRNREDFHLSGQLQHFDVNVLAGLAGVTAPPYDALLSGPFDASGKLTESDFHRIVASAMLNVSPGGSGEPLRGEVNVKYDGPAGAIELGHSWLELPKTRVDVSGVLGSRLAVKLETDDWKELAPALRRISVPVQLQKASVTFDGSVDGPLSNPRIAGHAAVQNAIVEGQAVDSAAGDFSATKSAVSVTDATVRSGNLRARITGSAGLTDWKVTDTSPLNANVQIVNAALPRLLAIAGHKNIPVTGTLNMTARIGGTPGDPHATADLTVSKGEIEGEPFDSVTGHAQYLNRGAQILTASIDAGHKKVNVSARFDHAPTTFLAGKLTFNVSSNVMPLDQIALVRRREPDVKGTVRIRANGAVEIDGASLNVIDLNADLNATALGQGPRNFGDLHFTAETKSDLMTAHLDSDAARAMIHGEGTMRLAGDYPVVGKVTFSNVGLNAALAAIMPQNPKENLDGSIAGEVTLRGPMKTPDRMTASLDVSNFELHPLTVTGPASNIPNLSLKNTAPIRATLANDVVRIENAHFQAPSTSLDVSGTVNLSDSTPLNLRIAGNMNLALAQSFDSDVTATGELAIDAGVRGALTMPAISGRAEIQNADLHLAGFANGLTNANGVITFSGRQATLQSFSAESGGGKVDIGGFAGFTSGTFAFRVEAKTRQVRLRYPAGISTVSDSDITLAGTSERSVASGAVIVRRVALSPTADVPAILASAAEPMKAPESSRGFLDNMNLDIQIETSSDVAFETSVTQSIYASASLRLRGTAVNPAVLGRINITQGELSFFGNKYTINQGSISFLNPARIDPILNVDLETKARGVEVTLTVAGPINHLGLSYRSDPPLQWADVVALLATGRSPTDPTLAAQNTAESQNLQQLGASGLIGEAIASPSGNLQRFFGVARIKLNPELIGITGSPTARLTIEQQVSPDLLFTYISDVSSTSTQLFQVEWDFNRKWSAFLTREENGYVGVNFAYKKRFK